jgi:acetyl esterase/lipase
MCSIDYRLSGEAIFPAQIEDVKCAVRWLRSVASRYGLNPDRIGLWGSSSGAHLAVLAGVSGPGWFETPEHAQYSSEVSAVVDGYGPVNFTLIDEQRSQFPLLHDNAESTRIGQLTPSSDPESFESLLLGAPILTCPERVQAANPITYVKPGVPPTLILHGTKDAAIPAQQSVLLFQALAGSGTEVTLCLIEGLGHGFLNNNDWDKDKPPMQVHPHLISIQAVALRWA